MVTTERSETDWMDPLNKLIWRKAIKDRETRVKIRDGHEFVLFYEKHLDKIEGKLVEKVWISPADANQFAPCGWFSVQKFVTATGAYSEKSK